MKNSKPKGTLVSCSRESYAQRKAAHEEFVKSHSWTNNVKAKKRRPRFKVSQSTTPERANQPKKVTISVGGFIQITVDYAEWKQHGSLGTVIATL